MNLKPDEAYREQRDIVREQIEQLTKLEEKSESDKPPSNTAVQMRKDEHKERLQERVEEQFSNRLYKQLMQAQASVIVTSSTAKFLVIQKEDKGLLNEYLRVCIDRAILETNFEDMDRPQKNQADVQNSVQTQRGWTIYKERFMNQIMKEAKMSKKANKLLDD